MKLEKEYNPDGWLGILIGTKLYFHCHSEETILSNMSALLKELTVRNSATDQDHGNLDSLTSNEESATGSWSNMDISNWLDNNGLAETKPLLRKFDGSVLMGLRRMYMKAPAVYYTSLKEQLGFKDLVQILRFTNALEKLK